MRLRSLFVRLFGIALLAGASAIDVAAAPGPKNSVFPSGQMIVVPGGSYRNIEAPALAGSLKKKAFFFVNVHVPYAGEIAGTDAFIPYDKASELLKNFPQDKNAAIVLYCRSGRMSDIAARVLVKAGYREVFNLTGGMNAWEESGLPIAFAK